jgi:tetratricopeptide (TPR) repeat protein
MTCLRWGGFKTVPPTRKVDGYIDAALAAGAQEHDRGWLLAMRAYLNTRKGDAAEIDAIPRADRSRAGEEAAEIGRRLGDVDLEVLALRALSGIWITAGDYGKAMEIAHEEGPLIERISATRDRALSIVFYVLRLMDIEGRYEDGLHHAEQAYRLGKELTIHEVQHGTYLLLYGNALLGRWSLIEGYLREHLDAWREDHDISCPYARAGPLVGAWVLAQQGNVNEARALLDQIPLDWEAPSMPEAWHGLARLACRDPEEAQSVAKRILEANRRLSYEEGPFEYWLMLEALVQLKDWSGLEAFLPSAERMANGLAILGPACTRAAALLNLADHRLEPAHAKLQQAIARFDQLGAATEAARTRELLAVEFSHSS